MFTRIHLWVDDTSLSGAANTCLLVIVHRVDKIYLHIYTHTYTHIQKKNYGYITLRDTITPSTTSLVVLNKVWRASIKTSFKSMRSDDGSSPELHWSKVTCRLRWLFTCSTGKLERGFAVSTMCFNPPNANQLLLKLQGQASSSGVYYPFYFASYFEKPPSCQDQKNVLQWRTVDPSCKARPTSRVPLQLWMGFWQSEKVQDCIMESHRLRRGGGVSEGRQDVSVIDSTYADECGRLATLSSSHKSSSRSLGRVQPHHKGAFLSEEVMWLWEWWRLRSTKAKELLFLACKHKG